MRLQHAGDGAETGSDQTFTGTVHVEPVVSREQPSDLHVVRVSFEAGARSGWHRHPLGQVLHVTEGVGRTQSRGGSVEEIRRGDSVVADPGEWHWHGAAPESAMTHLAIQEADADGVTTEWGALVTDAEYHGHQDQRGSAPTSE
jgi:quercetin dioxygenase-like cupin family protein